MPRFLLLALLLPLAACPPNKDDDSAGSTGGTGPLTGDPPQTSGATTTTGAATGGVPIDDCAFLAGKTFSSDAELECGYAPTGGGLCHWTISFTETGWDHQFSDYGENGTYTCEDGAIVGTAVGVAGDPERAGTIDGEAGKLLWDDVAYTVVP
jgi:hypothetical protein